MIKLKLMYNEPDTFNGMEVIKESSQNGSGNLYIRGPYTGSALNKNGRVYPKEELQKDINRYINEMVVTGRSMGELNHSNTADVNPERACHLVTHLEEDSDGTWYGKSKILTGEGIPCGNLVKGLINNGVTLGISTRSLGTLEEANGHKVVRNLRIVAFDCVADPSFPTAFVNGILESKEWILADNGEYEPVYEKFENKLKNIPKKDAESFLREQVIKFINSLR